MSSWFDRRTGWTCRECSHFNSTEDFTCPCTQRQVDREWARWERCRERWDNRDTVLARSLGDQLYRVRRWAGGRITFTVLVPGGYSYSVEPHRAPPSVIEQAEENFRR